MRFDPYTADTTAYAHLYALARHLGQSSLDPALRALVEVRVSQISGCGFCLGLHSPGARKAGVSQQKLDLLPGWREAEDFTDTERAALALAEEAERIGDGNRVSADTWQAARYACTDDDLSALLYTIGLIKVWNTLNVVSEFPVAGKLPKLD